MTANAGFSPGKTTMIFGRTTEMMSKRFSTILRAGALAALFVVGTSAAAFAVPIVTFQTTGVFDSTGTSAVQFNSATGNVVFTFAGIPFGLVDTPSTTSLGNMVLSAAEPGFSGLDSDGFTLFINQFSPSGTGELLATVSGTVASTNQSNFRLLFSTDVVTIAGVTYDLQQPNEGYFLVPPSTNSGVTSIQAFVVAPVQQQEPVIPEPATMMLLGTGLLAAFKARRRLGVNNDR